MNAVVSGCDEVLARVQMRDVLTDLDFIEITRGLMSHSGGDEIDVQIAM